MTVRYRKQRKDCIFGMHRNAQRLTPTSNMSWSGLATRVRLEHGRDLHEPGGQDGYNCLFIAAMHQLTDNGLPALCDVDVHQLRRKCRDWLAHHRTLLFGDACLCEFGDDYTSFVENDYAWGNHIVIFAILGVFGRLYDCCFSAKVRRCQHVCVLQHMSMTHVRCRLHAASIVHVWCGLYLGLYGWFAVTIATCVARCASRSSRLRVQLTITWLSYPPHMLLPSDMAEGVKLCCFWVMTQSLTGCQRKFYERHRDIHQSRTDL